MKWIDRLRRAVKAKGFVPKDGNLANHWLTCAVGERAAVLGFTSNRLKGYQLPVHIQRLGRKFDMAVYDENIALAFSLYTEIQEWELDGKPRA